MRVYRLYNYNYKIKIECNKDFFMYFTYSLTLLYLRNILILLKFLLEKSNLKE